MIQFNTVHGSDYKPNAPLAPGYYNALVLDYEEKQSKAGNPMIMLTLGIYEKPEWEKKNMFLETKYYVVYQPSARNPWWRFEKLVAACGHTFEQGESITLHERMFRGRKVAVRTSMNPGLQGGFFTQVDDVLKREEVPYLGKYSEDDWYRFKLDVNGVRDAGGGKSAPAPDDIPF